MVDRNMEQRPTTFVNYFREALFHKWSFRQAADRICQRSLAHTFQGISHPQTKFLYIERLGNIVICTNFKPLKAIDAFSFFCKEDNGNFMGTTIRSYTPGNFITINIWEPNIKDH